MPPFEEYCEEIRDIWDSHWLTNMGSKYHALQDALCALLGTPYIVMNTNGHLALENAISMFDFPRGGEIITTPFTFASTTHAIVRAGFTPVFCDVRNEDFTLDPEKLEPLITDKTVAIVPVHVYGNLCDVDAIARIAEKHHLKVVYDAAHAFAVKYRGVSSACFGDASMFSFHATKVFNTIEGGAVCLKDSALAEKLNSIQNFGLAGEDAPYVGGNAKMSEFQAAMGLCNLRHLNEEIEKRRIVVERYRSRLEGVKGLRLNPIQQDVTPNYAYFPVVFDGFKKDRNQVFEELKDNDVTARKYFYPLTSSFSCYRNLPTAGANKTPVAAALAEKVLTLPLYADLALEDVDRICEIVLS